MPKIIKFQRNNTEMQTASMLSDQELLALKEGKAPKTVLLQDMDDVHNIKLDSLTDELVKFLISFGCCFDNQGHKITDIETSRDDIGFVIFQRSLLEHLGSIFDKLSLLPMVGTQRLAVSHKETKTVYKEDENGNTVGVRQYLYVQAKQAAQNCKEIPGFQHFIEHDIEGVHQAIFVEFNRRFFIERPGIHSYFELAKKVYDITDQFSDESLNYQYIKSALQCYLKLYSILKPDSGMAVNYGQYQRVISAIKEFNALRIKIIDGASLPEPDFKESVDLLNSQGGVTHQSLQHFKKQVLAYMDAQLVLEGANTEQQRIMTDLDVAYKAVLKFGIDIVGESDVSRIVDHALEKERGFFHQFKEHYFQHDRAYQGDEKVYFQKLWDLHVSVAHESYSMIEADFRDVASVLAKGIQDIDSQYAKISGDKRAEIKSKFDLKRMQSLLHRFADDVLIATTNNSKQIIADCTISYLQGMGIVIDKIHYSLIDDKAVQYRPNFGGPVIEADYTKLSDGCQKPEDFISLKLLEPHLQQVLQFRPPLVVLALIATELAVDQESAKQDYKQKIAVNLANHPLFDAAIVACLVSDTDNLAAFKGNMLNRLMSEAQQLTTDASPIAYNRFAAQFFNFIASNLGRLPTLARDMLQQARIIAPNLNPAFLLARLLKAICSDIKAFYQTPVNDALVPDFEPSPEVETALKKVAESLGMIGLDAYAGQENVLSVYNAYEQTDEQKTLLSHMKTMTDPNALSEIKRSLPVAQDERPAQAAATAPTDMSARAATNTETAFNMDGSGNFTFQANTEVHVISRTTAPALAGEDDERLVRVVVDTGGETPHEEAPEELFARMQRIFDQLFMIVDGQIERLAGHEFFMTQTVDGNVTTVTVHAVVNAKGLVVFNKGNGELSIHIGDPINGSVATAVITRYDDYASIAITLPSSMGFCSADNKEYSIHALLIGRGQVANLNNRLGKPEKMYPLIEAQAETMHQLGEVFQAEYYIMARILYHYLRDNNSVDARSALDACRILAYLQAQNNRFSPGGDLHAIAGGLKELEKQVLTLRDLDSSPAYHRQRLQNIALGTFAVAETVGLMGATAFKQTVDDPLFLLQYKQEVVDIFQQYVFPALRATVAYDYGLGLFVIGAALFSIPRLYRRVRASATEVSMRRMLPNSSELGIFERITGYFGSAPAAATVSQRAKEQLLKMSEEFQRNMGSVPGDWQVYKKVSARNLRQQHFTVPYSPREQSVINGTILAKEILAPFSIAAVLPSLIQGLSKLNDPDVTDFAVSNILKVVMEEAVLAAGQYGFSFILPLILLLYFLPESALVDMWRVISNNMMTPLRTLCCSGNDDSDEGESEDDTLVEVVSRGVEGSGGVASGMQQQSSQRQRAPSGSPSMYGGSSLKQRLLSSEERGYNPSSARLARSGGND